MAARHENVECAVGGLEYHDAGVEDGLVVTSSGHLWEVEENIKVAEDDDVSINEDHSLIIRELPESELAVVVLVVGAILGPRISDPGYESDLPAGEFEGAAFRDGDGGVQEED